MSKKTAAGIENDFSSVMSFFGGRGILPDPVSSHLRGLARRMHRSTYSLILWKFRLSGLPEHAQVFVEEIASDALQVLPQALMGFAKTTRLLTRGVIENTLRHLYFADHPIEYRRMNRENKWYLAMEDLFAYPACHDQLMVLESKFDAVNRLKTLYGSLSAGIHGRRVQDLEMRASLEKLVLMEPDFEKRVQDIEACAASANFLLAAFHTEQFNALQREDQTTILQTMPATAKQVLHGLVE